MLLGILMALKILLLGETNIFITGIALERFSMGSLMTPGETLSD